jgi:hypothetical protein
MRIVVTVVASLVVAGSRAAAPPEPTGLWWWHAKWESPPAEVVKEIGPIWSAPGVLINFCPGGRLRIATGVFYRRRGPASLGVSDGLSLYEGQWSWTGEAITTTYRLVDSEIPRPNEERVMRTQLVEHPRIEDGVLLFTFRRADATSTPTLRFNRATLLEDRFVECNAQ